MPELPKLSIVTASFNSIHTIRDTIESVLRQNYPNFEHIVVDGGSRDGTLDVLKEYPHLRWISEKDEGLYHAMNKGIQMATGEAVNMLNSDDCFRPGALHAVGKAFAEHPEWDGLFGDIVYVDNSGKEIYRREEAVFDYNVLRFSGVCYVIHQTLFVKKAMHDRLGLYKHKQYVSAADYDFILELGRARCRIGHVAQYLISYRYHDRGQSSDLRVTRNMARESRLIRTEHGVPNGLPGRCLASAYKVKRQCQKLIRRGKIDLVPGTWKLRRTMKAATSFSSNIPMETIERAER